MYTHEGTTQHEHSKNHAIELFSKTGSPETALKNNVALVSGFSPAILASIFDGTDFSPIGIEQSKIKLKPFQKKILKKYIMNKTRLVFERSL
ncbi:MAG: hypothetical protein WC260_01480 [Candidatus Pacearchaeota archaeon]